ncbi:hypothetical protein GTY75_09030 [Streptomyces sp. SID8381]|uniref:hypothetical protein n=1 Tax=unclassified Streptomyces TaxID=2593676 RepID=UPI00131A361C|nr:MULTISPECIES: hypothetical protein [unclassified Streptomyces]MYX26810.1 hypothetical protein [Streptomyces sp. SID8381]
MTRLVRLTSLGVGAFLLDLPLTLPAAGVVLAWPGASAVTVAMYPEDALAALTNRVRKTVSSVEGITLRPSGERPWPHSTLAYYRSGDVHDAAFNRVLRDIRPPRVEITVNRLHAVYMHQDPDRGYYTWDHLAALPLCGTPKITVRERLDELADQAAREGDELWRDAWDRARSAVAPALGGEEISTTGLPTTSGEEYVDGAGALAIGFYLLARERNVPVAALTRDDIDELAGDWRDLSQPQLPTRWTSRLEALGHQLDDQDDPVMVRWRTLCYEHPEPDPDNPDASLYRVGHAGETGLRLVLSQHHHEHVRI